MNDRVKKCLEKDRGFAELLMNINGSYDDIVTGAFSMAIKYPDYKEKVTEFIEAHPELTSSDLVLFETETFRGFKRKAKYSFEK
jgi:hypothetical protein